MIEVQQAKEIRCARTHRLEARKNEHGMFLYCKGCKQEHFHTWEELYATAQAGGGTNATSATVASHVTDAPYATANPRENAFYS